RRPEAVSRSTLPIDAAAGGMSTGIAEANEPRGAGAIRRARRATLVARTEGVAAFGDAGAADTRLAAEASGRARRRRAARRLRRGGHGAAGQIPDDLVAVELHGERRVNASRKEPDGLTSPFGVGREPVLGTDREKDLCARVVEVAEQGVE